MRHRCLGPFGSGTAGRRRCRSRAPPIDEDALKAAAKRLGAAKRPLIVAGGGALEASAEVTQLRICCKRRFSPIAAAAACSAIAIRFRSTCRSAANCGPRRTSCSPSARICTSPLLHWGFDRDLAVISHRRRSGRACAHRQTQGRADRAMPGRSCSDCSIFCRPTMRAGHRAPTRCANAMTACASAWRSSRRNLPICPRSAPNCRRTAFSSTR